MIGITRQGGKPPGNPVRQLHATHRASSCAKRDGHVQLCSNPRGARGIEPETFRRRGQLLIRPPATGPKRGSDTAQRIPRRSLSTALILPNQASTRALDPSASHGRGEAVDRGYCGPTQHASSAAWEAAHLTPASVHMHVIANYRVTNIQDRSIIAEHYKSPTAARRGVRREVCACACSRRPPPQLL